MTETVDGTQIESFAVYLAKALIARKGYHAGTVPEAHRLFEHCDAVLTRMDGMALEIVGIVDRETDPARKFDLTKEILDSIGTACLRYSGKAGFRKLPVAIQIIEVSNSAVTPETIARLKLLKNRSPFSKVLLSALAIDGGNRELWTNAPMRGRIGMRPFIKGLMARPRLSEAQLLPEMPAIMPEKRPLYLTYCLLAAIAIVFVCEYVFRADSTGALFDPGIRTLIALGALDKKLVAEGEWWRLFSAPLLHGGLVHIALNGIALFFAGMVLENVIGRAWYAAVFAISGLCGGLLSLTLNPPTLISVGASGAIMGLFAAAFAVSYRYPTASPMRTFLQSGSLRVLIPSLIPLADGLFGQKIDYAAHLGGAIGGGALGILFALLWRKESLFPPYRSLGSALAAIGLCGVFYSGVQIANGYEEYAVASYLIPEDQIPKETIAWKEKSAGLVASYPRDPRSHMYRALALNDAGDGSGAEQEWRAALAEEKVLRSFFKPALEQFIRGELALTLKENGKATEARKVAQSVCGAKSEISAALATEGLCL